MTTFSFQNKSTTTIANEILALVDANGSMEDVTEAFEAVYNQVRDLECFITDKVEAGLIERAKQDGAGWAKVTAALDAKPDDRQAMTEQLALLEDLPRLRPMAQAFVKVFNFKRNASEPWTLAIHEAFPKLSDDDKKCIPALAELFANTYDKLENNIMQSAVKPDRAPQWTDIVGILNEDGATPAITRLESFDDNMRQDFTNMLEKDFLYNAKNLFENGQRRSVTAYKAENEKQLPETITFGKYLEKTQGAAADPKLDLYIDALSTIASEPPENYSSIAAVLPSVEARRSAVSSQQKLKLLSQKRKAHAAGVRA